MDEKSKTLAISYITTNKDQTYLEKARVDERSFYPPGTFKIQKVDTGNTTSLINQDGYQLREDVINLTEEDLAYFESFTARTPLVSVSYKDYAPVETILIVLKEKEAVEGTLEGTNLHYTFTAPEPMAIRIIGHYDSAALLSYSQNGKKPKFPLELKQGDSVDLLFSDPYNLASNDELLLEIETTDEKKFSRHLKTTMEIPDGYLKQLVTENQ